MPVNAPYTCIAAALLLLGRETVSWPGWPSTEEILELTGSGRTQAYAVTARLRELLPSLLGKPGRPPSTPAPTDALLVVSRCIQDYLMRHPGSAHFHQGRFHYLDDFRRFIVGLVGPGQPGEGLSVAQLADATSLPLGTLKSWFSKGPGLDSERELQTDVRSLRREHQHQIISLFQTWKGTFVGFCRMVREQHRLNYGPTSIGTLLHQAGVRRRKQSEKQQNRGTFLKLFPGAQWLGDGSTLKIHRISVTWGEETFAFNLEAILDVASDALVGMYISDSEDEDALLNALQDAIETAGQASLSLSLDNKPCNHTLAVLEATAEAEAQCQSKT